MKRLLLLLGAILIMEGCDSVVSKEYVVVKLKPTPNGFCNYVAEDHDAKWYDYQYINFIDSIGKYNLGDTLIIRKK